MADYTPIKDSDALSATGLDSRFSTLESAVNAVEGVEARTFDHYHGTVGVVEPGVAFLTGARFMGHAGHPSSPTFRIGYYHRYSLGDPEGDPLYPGPDFSNMAGVGSKGWRVIGDSLPTAGDIDYVQGRADGKLECTFSSMGRLSQTRTKGFDQVGGVLVMLNAEVLFFHDYKQNAACVGRVTSGAAGDTFMKIRAHFALQANVWDSNQVEKGWFNVKKTHRTLSMPSAERTGSHTATKDLGRGIGTANYRSVRGAMWKDISIRTCITRQDLNTTGLADNGDLTSDDLIIRGVRAVISLEVAGKGATSPQDLFDYSEDGMGITLKAYSMSTLILSSKGL
jgi:hypothetical protein